MRAGTCISCSRTTATKRVTWRAIRMAGAVIADAQWNDDVHHALHVITTGETDGYYADYADQPVRRLGRCLAEGFAYQGEPSAFRGGARRGEPSGQLPPSSFVVYTQTHDQVGNRARGERLSMLADADALRAGRGRSTAFPVCADAVHGRGVRRVEPVPFLLRLRTRAGRRRHARPAQRVQPLRALSAIRSRGRRFRIRMTSTTFRRQPPRLVRGGAPAARSVARFLCKLVAQACGAHHAAARWHPSRRLVAS